MKRALLFLIAVFSCGAQPAAAQIPCRYELVATIQGPNCGITGITGLTPTAISPNGMYVTGWYQYCQPPLADNPFLWIGPPPGTLFTIPRPPGVETARGYDVNDSGTVVGMWQQHYDTGNPRGFIYSYPGGTWTNLLPTPPGDWCEAAALNNAGTVVGYRSLGPNQFPREAVIWTNNGSIVQGLGVMNGPSSGATAISANGIVAGWTGSQPSAFFDDTRGFIWQNGSTIFVDPVPGGTSSMPRGVNSSGHLALHGKTQSVPVYLSRCFLYNDGNINDLPIPPGFDRAAPAALTAADFLVGNCSHSSAGSSLRACVWQGAFVELLANRIFPLPWNPNLSNAATDVASDGAILVDGRLGSSSLPVAFIVRPLASTPGDTNCDNHVNVDDILNVINAWGRCQACSTDFDHNNQVNVDDLLTVIFHWSS